MAAFDIWQKYLSSSLSQLAQLSLYLKVTQGTQVFGEKLRRCHPWGGWDVTGNNAVAQLGAQMGSLSWRRRDVGEMLAYFSVFLCSAENFAANQLVAGEEEVSLEDSAMIATNFSYFCVCLSVAERHSAVLPHA